MKQTKQAKKKQPPGHEPVGRPQRTVELGDWYQLRLTNEDRQRWGECAKAAGMTLAQWIRLHAAIAAGGKVRIVRAEFVTTYPVAQDQTPLHVRTQDAPVAGHPQAIADGDHGLLADWDKRR